MVNLKLPNNQMRLSVESFKVSKENNSKEAESGDSETVRIEGFALPFDTVSRNGVLYRKESIIAAAETMVGRPMFFNHNIDELPIGQVEAFEVSSDGKGMSFKAVLDNKSEREKEIVEKVRSGRINKVSIQCMYENVTFNDEEGTMAVDVSEFLELSPVTIPGFDDTTAMAVESYKQMSKVKKEAKKIKEDVVSEQDDDESSTVEARLDAIESRQAEFDTRLGTVEARLDVEEEESDSEEESNEEETSKETDEDPEEKEEKLDDDDPKKEIKRATAPAAKEETKESFDANKWKAERRKTY